MRDRDVRPLVREMLTATRHAATVIEEVGVGGVARADIVVVDDVLEAIEIKSTADTLHRLTRQASAYSLVFDHVTIVAASRHVEQALHQIPAWWGCLEVGEQEFALTLIPRRSCLQNPALDPDSILQLLWRDELLEHLNNIAPMHTLERQPRHVLREALINHLHLDDIRARTRQSLKNRSNWSTARPPH